MDSYGVQMMVQVCAYLPLLGLFALLLPKDSVIMGAPKRRLGVEAKA